MAMQAPWAMYCSIGCAASPSSATRPATHVRPQAVGADQRRSRHPLASGETGADGRAVLVVTRDLARDAQLDQRMRAAGGQKHAVQVAAMDHGVRVAVALAEGLAEVD